jgi:hypothetical protein
MQRQVLARETVWVMVPLKLRFVPASQPRNGPPALAAGLQEKPWSLGKVVEMTEAYWLRNAAKDDA